MGQSLAMGRVAATAIVLAGGRSSRFGWDKLTAEVDGVPLLVRAARAVVEVCPEVVVVGPSGGLSAELPAMEGVSLLLDATSFGGPLMALARAAPAARHDRLLLVGGDMPELHPPLLRRLLVWPDGREGACLLLADQAQPMPVGLDRQATVLWTGRLMAASERSLRSLIAALVVDRIPEIEWRTLDPDARSLRDIDRPGDLRDLRQDQSEDPTLG
jgi:molybdopterin-guanine dinucleotide biosynthesis protein A